MAVLEKKLGHPAPLITEVAEGSYAYMNSDSSHSDEPWMFEIFVIRNRSTRHSFSGTRRKSCYLSAPCTFRPCETRPQATPLTEAEESSHIRALMLLSEVSSAELRIPSEVSAPRRE